MNDNPMMEDIVADWLRSHGYDGLLYDLGEGEQCGCTLDDLFPCEDVGVDCEAAYRHDDGLMYPTKQKGR